MVPVRMKGSDTSLVSAVFQPSVKAQSNRNGSSSTGKPRASVAWAHSSYQPGGMIVAALSAGTSLSQRCLAESIETIR